MNAVGVQHDRMCSAGTCHDNTTWHGLVPRLLLEHGAIRVAEIGVWRGTLSAKILAQCPLVEQLILVDSWTPIYGTDPVRGLLVFGPGTDQAEMDDAERTVRRRFVDDVRVVIHTLPSREGAKRVPDRSLDAILIDALHTYHACKEDILTWLPKLRPGGLMIGDDYSDWFPGVEIAVKEIFGEQYRVLDQTWWAFQDDVTEGLCGARDRFKAI